MATDGSGPLHPVDPPVSPAIEAALPEGDAQLYLHPQTLARLGSMELRAKMIVEGVMSGAHRSPFQGFSVEFAQHRPYAPGDDIRHLDWKVFARTDKLQLKQYQQETNLDLVVMVDASGSMNFGSRSFADASGSGRKTSPDGRPNWTKFDHATALAAAISYVTLRQGDRAGLVTFADGVLHQVRRSSSSGTWRQIVGALSQHSVDHPTNFTKSIDQTLAKVTNRSLVAIVSDFFEDPEAIRAGLAKLRHKRHDVICFQVLDLAEETFDFRDAAPFVGLEGEAVLRVDPRAIRQGYLKALREHTERVQRIARGFGFDIVRVRTHDWLGPALASFVARRNAQIKRSKYG
ncbi:MAG: DUF58 domain-containing protein [Phycisphaerales bacterium]|nr:MAG: DUF58 domain-containing protein [Phycisphaerales bacterium]